MRQMRQYKKRISNLEGNIFAYKYKCIDWQNCSLFTTINIKWTSYKRKDIKFKGSGNKYFFYFVPRIFVDLEVQFSKKIVLLLLN